jgi:hypothetical protein
MYGFWFLVVESILLAYKQLVVESILLAYKQL